MKKKRYIKNIKNGEIKMNDEKAEKKIIEIKRIQKEINEIFTKWRKKLWKQIQSKFRKELHSKVSDSRNGP